MRLLNPVLLSTLLLLSKNIVAEVRINMEPPDVYKGAGKTIVWELAVGDKAKISQYSVFCTDAKGNLAIDGLEPVESSEYGKYFVVEVMPGMKLKITTPGTYSERKELLRSFLTSEFYAKCNWWTWHKGKYLRTIDSIDGYQSISALVNHYKNLK